MPGFPDLEFHVQWKEGGANNDRENTMHILQTSLPYNELKPWAMKRLGKAKGNKNNNKLISIPGVQPTATKRKIFHTSVMQWNLVCLKKLCYILSIAYESICSC